MTSWVNRVLLLGTLLVMSWPVGGACEGVSLVASVQEMGTAMGIYSMAFSPDGKMLATGSYSGEIALWDVDAGRLLTVLHAVDPWVHRSSVKLVTFRNDGARLAACFWGGDVVIWDLASEEQLVHHRVRGSLSPSPFGPVSTVQSAAFADDLASLITAYLDHRVWRWDMTTGESMGDPLPLASARGTVVFSPEGHFLAFGDEESFVHIWDVAAGSPTAQLEEAGRPIAFRHDAEVIASLDGPRVSVWSVSTGERLTTLHAHDDEVTRVAFHPNGALLASASEDGELILWDLGQEAILERLDLGTKSIRTLTFSPTGTHLAAGLSYFVPTTPVILLWPMERLLP